MEAKSAQGSKGVRGDLILVVIVLLALVLAAAFYQQNLLNYWKLQGWNTGEVRQTMERFVREGHEGNTSAGELLDTSMIQAVVEEGKFVGVRHPGPVGPVVVRTTVLLPDATVKDCRVRIKNRTGVYQADVQFGNGKWAPFDVDRVQGALRIRSVPDVLSPTQPPVQPWD